MNLHGALMDVAFIDDTVKRDWICRAFFLMREDMYRMRLEQITKVMGETK